MPQALGGPHVQLAFRLWEIERGCGECEKAWKKAGKVFEVPGELTNVDIGYVKELTCG